VKILLVDDDTDNMSHFADELEVLGHLVVHARNVPELRAALADLHFDGIIIDLMMPGLDEVPDSETQSGYLAGVYLYERYVAGEQASAPFVVLTAVSSDTTVFASAARRLSAFPSFRGIIGKPVLADDVIRALGGDA
jgi:CheY-like chemotaxis protein